MKFIKHKALTNNINYIYYECQLIPKNNNFIPELINISKSEATNYNNKQANRSDNNRSFLTLYSDVFVGLLTEYIWEYFLNNRIKVKDSCFVSKTSYSPEIDQIDLITHNNHTIEVRSSNVRNGILFAINNFDILGPYTNKYKPHEDFKSFYLRTLYTLTTEQILLSLKNDRPISLYLMGGATRSMMENDDLVVFKDLKPFYDRSGYTSKYRCIPIKSGLDADDIILELNRLD